MMFEPVRCFGRVRLAGGELLAQHGPPGAFGVSVEIVAELRHHAATQAGLEQLAGLLEVWCELRVSDVLERVLGALESGALAWVPRAGFGPVSSFTLPEPPMTDLCTLAGPEAIGVEYAIELEIIDQDGEPVGGLAYRLALPDGSVREGTVDADGIARVSGLTSAEPCEVCFPTLDATAWSYVHASPL